jgi:hypothetical protein
MLTLEGVVAGYGGGDVLQGVDITVERGSVACIVCLVAAEAAWSGSLGGAGPLSSPGGPGSR